MQLSGWASEQGLGNKLECKADGVNGNTKPKFAYHAPIMSLECQARESVLDLNNEKSLGRV